MKIVKWKEAIALNKKFLYMYLSEYDGRNWEDDCSVYVSYPFNVKGVISEVFPITKPADCWESGCEDYTEYEERLNKFLHGDNSIGVSSLATSRDVVSDEEQENLIVLFEDSDIDIWIEKLNEIKFNN